MKFDIVTFGSAVKDLFVATDFSERDNFVYYPVGSKILIKELRFDIGGGGTNTAVAFSRLGFKTGFVGKVADDFNGYEILNLLKKEGVKFLGKIEKKGTTGFSIILDSRARDRTILTYKGINDHIRFDDIRRKNFKTKWLYYTSLLGDSLDTQITVARKMKISGTKLAFNPSLYMAGKKDAIEPLLTMSDILILNKEEAQMLVKKTDLLAGLHNLTGGIVVITDRDKKIQAFDGNKRYYIIPNKVRVVERTGAGDAFASGFVAGQIIGKDIDYSLKLGLRESESVIKYFGAKNNLLRMDLKNIWKS